MIRIAVVDDEEVFRRKISALIRSVTESSESTASEICEYEDGRAFLEAAEQGLKFDILFADIRMEGIGGMETGRRIRRICPDITIIFITSFEEYAAESYRIEAYQYILKQDLESRLPGVVHKLVSREVKEKDQYRIVKNGTEAVRIPYSSIIYLYKSKGAKYVNYVTKSGIYKERISMETVLKEMDCKLFLPAGRGYAVNMRQIRRVRQDILYLEGGYEVQVSRAKLPELKRQISRCWKEL